MEDNMAFKVDPAIRIATAMRQKGFIPATETGVKIQNVSADYRALWILFDDPENHDRTKDRIPPKMLLGVIRFNDSNDWRIEYYGSKYLSQIEELVTYLIEQLSVKIDVSCTREYCGFETLPPRK